MNQKIKKFFYFPLAYYFYFFAKIKLSIWKPRVICITGSSGKTTLLHFLESQIKNAHFSHKANSAFGIPFDILGIKRNTYSIFEWPFMFLFAPLSIFKNSHKEKLYVAEVDCDRPMEGKFLSSLLNPSVTLWLSTGSTHTINFNKKNFLSSQEAVAFEYGYFIEKTKDKVFINSDVILIENQLYRTNAQIEKITLSYLSEFKVKKDGVVFVTDKSSFKFSYLIPKETFYSVIMTKKLCDFLGLPFDYTFGKLNLPPGRSSLFKGIKKTKIIDSSYNSSFLSLKSMLELFQQYPSDNKWVIIGDILELGEKEKEEHEKIAELLNNSNFQRIILIGPRVKKYTLPTIRNKQNLVNFLNPVDALNYLEKNLKGKETMLFKGARFLEGIIEHLLEDEADIKKLCRREKIWENRRKQWGL